ncbi:ATP-binding protein [Ancylobacter amanitiformis]|uniref:ATPase/DNA-binding winged helix-turn-helix (WHTH) protein n=1 Tax=Ancylobacter amanitiformis TaxID=217069 RepID=A0ABU0LS82_9HYPH|nr:winged helix-turn-helix domain-containing protein [Ancylobacter amanitiformis]MDQ0511515.1 putative ATPase/DNA-binding winged helix-turn-helix (wHTH) protein [Ancylobacter amanitiformis]
MIEQDAPPGGQVRFGPFTYFPAQQLLAEDGTAVNLGSRARAILFVLLEHHGEVVTKAQLIQRVWPETFVEEANLRVHIAALRRALGDGQDGRRYIVNISGRGYSFVFPVEREDAPPSREKPPGPSPVPSNLPPALPRLIGRAATVQYVASLLREQRFVSLVGPGGIGKSTVAIAVAHESARGFSDGICFVDLSALSDPQLVPAAVAAALGVGLLTEAPMQSLIAATRSRRRLLLLDSCEHVIDAVSTLAEELFAKGGEGLHILATTREPLRVRGERIHRLSSLDAPPASERLTSAEALEYPAVQLFVERAAATFNGFRLIDSEAPVVADLCRRLDGIALAIEIAAGRVESLGVAGLASRLDDRFRLQLQGRRTALRRHQTLSTLLDWSYMLLPPFEQLVLRQLAILAGNFTVDDAMAIVADDGATDEKVVNALANLVEKSLIAADVHGSQARYRLLDMTRAYAALKLAESGKLELLRRRHAEIFRDTLDRAALAWAVQPAPEWTRDHRHLIDNARAALEWAFSPGGDAEIGVALTLGTVPLWFQLQLIAEAHGQVRMALARIGSSHCDAVQMRLQAALAWSLMQIRGQVEETRVAWQRTLDLAESLDDTDYQLRALWGLWSYRLNRSQFHEALALAHHFADVAARHSDLNDSHIGHRMIGYILHLLGRQTEARQHIERMVNGYVVPVTGDQIIRFVFEQKVLARCFLARILWLQGSFDAAMAEVDDIVAVAEAADDRLSLCQVLVQAACPVALFADDMPRARRFITRLVDESARDGIEFWQVWGQCFAGVMAVREGSLPTGIKHLGDALGRLRSIAYGVYYSVFLAEYAQALAKANELERANTCLTEALTRSEENEERWFVPELRRLSGEFALLANGPDAADEAERHLTQALEMAREQQALFWEIKAAISLARLWQTQGRAAEAEALLSPLIHRCVSDGDQPVVREAREVLGAMARGLSA